MRQFDQIRNGIPDRHYTVSPNKMSQADGYTYCSSKLNSCSAVVAIFQDMNSIYFPIGLGLGLAVWKDVDSYKDIAHIAATLNLSVITALNNKNLHDCNGSYDSSTSCDGQLVIFNMNYGEARLHPYNFFKVWQQTKNGSEETFTHIQAYGR